VAEKLIVNDLSNNFDYQPLIIPNYIDLERFMPVDFNIFELSILYVK
jgi:hypothetical protein